MYNDNTDPQSLPVPFGIKVLVVLTLAWTAVVLYLIYF